MRRLILSETSASQARPPVLATETLYLDAPVPQQPSSWWQTYESALKKGPLGPVARQILHADSSYVVERGIFASDARVRCGVVMGSVQSGKTASMIGTSALAIDAGVDVLVILAGTRTSLWRQTYERVVDQLGLSGPAPIAGREHLLRPNAMPTDVEGHVPLPALYAINGPLARRTLARGRPIIFIAMKNVHHLRALSACIRESLVAAMERLGRPVRMVVLDDEADDGSILDAAVESGLDPSADDLKQIPRAIVDLWESRPHLGVTMSPQLSVTYVAYTATPQANFLQSDHNPLAPRDFLVSLRTPMDRGSIEPRSTTYLEPSGLSGSYTGGEIFYERVPSLCVPLNAQSDGLGDALRSYFVGAAVRLWRNVGRLRPSQVDGLSFSTAEDATRLSPSPHSMLVHPSAAIQDHFEVASQIVAWAMGGGSTVVEDRGTLGPGTFTSSHLISSLVDDEGLWSSWLHRFAESAVEIREADLGKVSLQPTIEDWPKIREVLLNEVLPYARISVINSDPGADDRPEFGPRLGPEGWSAPRDLLTIFVSGNVMSRGLTLEGLATTLFLRESGDPIADTQMQMQRWFGYRGSYLDLNRVFLPSGQLELFQAYHANDEALRRVVIEAMNSGVGEPLDPIVLQGPGFSATGKIAHIRNIPLCPGSAPFVRAVNEGGRPDPNVDLVAGVFSDDESREVEAGGIVRGRVLGRTLSLMQAAELLDGLTYEAHWPDAAGWQARRWRALESQMANGSMDDTFPLYRPVSGRPGVRVSRDLDVSPWAMAAYFRLWNACLTRRVPGLVSTENARLRWSMVDLQQKRAEQPRFHIGIRYGSADPISSGPLSNLDFSVKPMSRTVDGETMLRAGWGSRNPGSAYFGDSFFDYHVHGETLPRPGFGDTTWRPVGHPGLILFHVIGAEGNAVYPRVAVGVGIPLGGPDQFAALAAS